MARRTAVLTATLAALPGVAGACPVCFDTGNPIVAHFYQVSTMMLSFLPFVILGGLAWAANTLRKPVVVVQEDPSEEPARGPLTDPVRP